MTNATFFQTSVSYFHFCHYWYNCNLQWCFPSEQIRVADAPECESDGERDVSDHRNLSIFTSSAPVSLTGCLPWQRLFSDQLGVSLASAPSLYSAHSGCTSANQTGLYQWHRERGGARESQDRRRMEGKNSRKQTTSGRKKVFDSVGGKLWNLGRYWPREK